MLNFVIFSLSRWNENFGCNIRDISYELSKNHKVLFIDVPLKRKDKWFNKKLDRVIEVKNREKEKLNLVEVKENLWHYIDFSVLESVNSIKNPALFDIINKYNSRVFARVIKNATQILNFKEYILFNDNDIYNGYHLKELLSPKLYVYYLRDRLSAMQYWKLHVTRLESSLIKRVDLVVANSTYLTESALMFNSHSYYIGQGCDIEHFANEPDKKSEIEIFKRIKSPIVGYIGALNSERLDINLIYDVANNMFDHNFVFVGKEDTEFEKSRLHELKNIHFLGNQKFSELPGYLRSFDVAINPQLLNDITLGNYPRKVDEYLAAGVPVVATDTPTMKPFSEHVYLCKSVSDYIQKIKIAIQEDSSEKRNARKFFASNHNWENSVNQFMHYCKMRLDEKG